MASYPRRQKTSEPSVIDAEILNLDRSINMLDFLNLADLIQYGQKDPLYINIRLILQPVEARVFSA